MVEGWTINKMHYYPEMLCRELARVDAALNAMTNEAITILVDFHSPNLCSLAWHGDTVVRGLPYNKGFLFMQAGPPERAARFDTISGAMPVAKMWNRLAYPRVTPKPLRQVLMDETNILRSMLDSYDRFVRNSEDGV